MGVKLIRLLIENLNKKAKWRNGDQPEITTVSQLLDMLTHKVNNSSVLFFSKKVLRTNSSCGIINWHSRLNDGALEKRLTHLPFTQAFTGSNPVRVTMYKFNEL